MEFESSFLIINREAFDVINKINRMPGILNDAAGTCGATRWTGCARLKADGSRWMWRDANVRSWSSSVDPERRYGASASGFVVGSAVMAVLSVVGSAFGIVHGVDNFTGASILAFSGVSYLLMWTSYFLFARRLRAAGWFAPILGAELHSRRDPHLDRDTPRPHGVEPGETFTQSDPHRSREIV